MKFCLLQVPSRIMIPDLLNVDSNCIGRLAIDCHNQIGLSDAPDVECEGHVDLVEASELSLSIGIEHR